MFLKSMLKSNIQLVMLLLYLVGNVNSAIATGDLRATNEGKSCQKLAMATASLLLWL